MHFTLQITQRLNKLIRSLNQKKYRDQNSLFLVEGEKLCDELFKSNFITELAVIREYPTAESIRIAEMYAEKGIPVYNAPKTQFDQMSSTKSPQGILAVANIRENRDPLDESFIALDGISDPGNVGTIIRTAEWFGVNQVIMGRGCSDKYNPKVVRSTMGAIFRTRVIQKVELDTFLPEHFKGYDIYGSSIRAKTYLKDIQPKDKFGIIFGSEANGISKEVSKLAKKKFKIQGIGGSESLNVATAVGISLYHFSLVNEK